MKYMTAAYFSCLGCDEGGDVLNLGGASIAWQWPIGTCAAYVYIIMGSGKVIKRTRKEVRDKPGGRRGAGEWRDSRGCHIPAEEVNKSV